MVNARWSSAVLLIAVAACADTGEMPDATQADGAPAPAVATTQPDTTAEALWSHLQQSNYRSWQRWPGTQPLYPGTEPHGMLLTTYVNELAQGALASGAAVLPAGAIVVKENYMPDSTYAAATVMYKVTGYDPQSGDWFWAKYDMSGVAEVAGRATMCRDCHAAARERDYLMTAQSR